MESYINICFVFSQLDIRFFAEFLNLGYHAVTTFPSSFGYTNMKSSQRMKALIQLCQLPRFNEGTKTFHGTLGENVVGNIRLLRQLLNYQHTMKCAI